jgi:P4 family phage/plasmid primase-like protien
LADSIDGTTDPYDRIDHYSATDGIKSWPKPPDIDGVQAECGFLRAFKADPQSGFSALMALSVLSHLHDDSHESKVKARSLCHEYLGGISHLTSDEVAIVDQSIEAAHQRGPVTCAQVNAHRPECGTCPHFKKITSPITIEGETFARSKYTGFYKVKMKDGMIPVKTKEPDYLGLAKEFKKHHDFITISERGATYIYKDNYWQEIVDLDIKGFAHEKLDPEPLETVRREFLNWIKSVNRQPAEWFHKSTDGLINMQNGVFRVETGELLPHDKAYGFTYILPYAYDKNATCEGFIKFLLQICCNDLELVEVLQEYLGYAISNSPCYAEKALFLYGPKASNGKSTLVKVMQNLVGRDNYSSVTLDALNKDTKRYMLENKLFNVSEETNVRALSESEVFKVMVTGGELDVKKLYSQDYTIKNKAKLFVLCNELPRSGDRTDGLYRRMIIFPMNARFSDELGNRVADMDERLSTELPGIFNFCVEGFKRLKKNKFKFTKAKEIGDILEQYKIENDNVLLWLHEKTEKDGMDSYETKDNLYQSYKDFCKDSGIERPLNKTWFFRGLKNIHNGDETQKNTAGKRFRVIHGIKLLA